MENLTDDLMMEILLHLPVKTLLRSKCVCKSWLSVISEPYFAKLHFQRSSQHTHRFPLFVHRPFRYIRQQRIQSIDIDASLSDNSATAKFDVPIFPSHILGSCRGFLLLRTKKRVKFLVWNPSTGEHRQILLPRSQKFRFQLHAFFYDESTDDYFIVLASWKNVNRQLALGFWVFSIRSNSWSDHKEFAFGSEVEFLPLSPVFGSVVKGVIHWIVYFTGFGQPPEANILALDIKTNKVGRVPKPDGINDYDLVRCLLRVFRGYLFLFDLNHSKEIKVWVMITNSSSWWSSSWMKLQPMPRKTCLRDYFSPLCFTKDGQFVTLHDGLSLSKWSIEGKREEHRMYGGYLEPSYMEAGVMYTDTLLSLPSQCTPD